MKLPPPSRACSQGTILQPQTYHFGAINYWPIKEPSGFAWPAEVLICLPTVSSLFISCLHCSRACQEASWHLPSHKSSCSFLEIPVSPQSNRVMESQEEGASEEDLRPILCRRDSVACIWAGMCRAISSLWLPQLFINYVSLLPDEQLPTMHIWEHWA